MNERNKIQQNTKHNVHLRGEYIMNSIKEKMNGNANRISEGNVKSDKGQQSKSVISQQTKIVLTLIIVLLMSIGLMACGNSNAESKPASKSEKITSESSNEKEQASEASTTNNAQASEDGEGNETSTLESSSNSASATDSTIVTTSAVVVPDGFTERDFDIGYSDYETLTMTGGSVTITEAGSYLLTGEMEGQIVVDVPGTEDKVQLILDNVTLTNDSSAAIYVLNADKVFFTTTEGSVNQISTTGSFVQTDENEVDGAIFSKADIVFNGSGKLTVTCNQGHAIVSKDDLKITSGTYELEASGKGLSANDLIGIAGGDITITAGDDAINAETEVHIIDGNLNLDAMDDGIHADAILTVDGGTIIIDATEGMESTVVTLNDGDINIAAYDDGINATQKVTDYTPTLEINGGNITVSMSAGDTDALDSNGYLYINGGVVNINAQFPFDYDYGGEITGGEVYVNGQQVTELYNAMMGGHGGFMGGGGPGGGRP